jgi:hypothetical protein
LSLDTECFKEINIKKTDSTSLAPIASPVRFARVQWKSFCAGVRHKRLERIAGTAPKNNIKPKNWVINMNPTLKKNNSNNLIQKNIITTSHTTKITTRTTVILKTKSKTQKPQQKTASPYDPANP